MDLKAIYKEICNEPKDADSAWYRMRGYKFEVLLSELLKVSKMEPRTSYKTKGEQVDGSFFLDGSVYLLEAKWHNKEMPASTLYEFKGKVDGKLAGTIGVFVSMSGYSSDAVDALSKGKTLNLILFDKRDIDAIFDRNLDFKSVLKSKLRKAAEEGIAFFPTEIESLRKTKKGLIEIDSVMFDHISQSIMIKPESKMDHVDLYIVCEGYSDREIISILAQKILSKNPVQKNIRIVAAMGKHAIPKIVNAISSAVGDDSRILVVADSDGDVNGTKDFLKNKIDTNNWLVSIPHPEIEQWLGETREALRVNRVAKAAAFAEKIDVNSLRVSDQAFAVLFDTLDKL